jgi:hypothetical protein
MIASNNAPKLPLFLGVNAWQCPGWRSGFAGMVRSEMACEETP